MTPPKEPVTIFVRRAKSSRVKLTLQVNKEKLQRTRKQYKVNYSYIVEQIMDHIDKYGIEGNQTISLKLTKPKEVKA